MADITGAGAHSFVEFIENCEEDPAAEGIYLIWAQGFMTALNVVKAMQQEPTKNPSAHPPHEARARIRALFEHRHPEAFYLAVAAYYHLLPEHSARRQRGPRRVN